MEPPNNSLFPWEYWNSRLHQNMHPLQVFYSRTEVGLVRRAILSAPFYKSVWYDGEEHRLIDYMDIKVSANGKAYDMKGNRLPQYDLNFSINEQDNHVPEGIPATPGTKV